MGFKFKLQHRCCAGANERVPSNHFIIFQQNFPRELCISELKLVQVKLSGINSLESHVAKSFAASSELGTGSGWPWPLPGLASPRLASLCLASPSSQHSQSPPPCRRFARPASPPLSLSPYPRRRSVPPTDSLTKISADLGVDWIKKEYYCVTRCLKSCYAFQVTADFGFNWIKWVLLFGTVLRRDSYFHIIEDILL